MPCRKLGRRQVRPMAVSAYCWLQDYAGVEKWLGTDL